MEFYSQGSYRYWVISGICSSKSVVTVSIFNCLTLEFLSVHFIQRCPYLVGPTDVTCEKVMTSFVLVGFDGQCETSYIA